MASPPRKVPLTPLDSLRVLLGEYGEGDPTFPVRLTQAVQKLKKQALVELGGRLSAASAPGTAWRRCRASSGCAPARTTR